MIKRVKAGYRIFSKSGKNLGTYKTREAAEKRLKQIEMMKHMKQDWE